VCSIHNTLKFVIGSFYLKKICYSDDRGFALSTFGMIDNFGALVAGLLVDCIRYWGRGGVDITGLIIFFCVRDLRFSV
jgi:hypothetical protein